MVIKNKDGDNFTLKITMQEKTLTEYFNIKECPKYLKKNKKTQKVKSSGTRLGIDSWNLTSDSTLKQIHFQVWEYGPQARRMYIGFFPFWRFIDV